MASILITGISGFVGGHFTRYLLGKKTGYDIHGVSRSKPVWDVFQDQALDIHSITFHPCDLLDSTKINTIIKETQPDLILHLASFSSVAQSWQDPRGAFLNNTNAFLNIIEGVRIQELDSKILSIGSSEEYGIVNASDLPLTEGQRTNPTNPYAIAKVSEEYLSQIYVKGYHLNICCTRSFNHIGPGQRNQFVVSSIAKQFADIAVNRKKPIIKIGAGSIIRDFIDIDDVILAYDTILEKGIPGEVYNVCSGRGYSIQDIVDCLSRLTQISIEIEQKTDLLRPIDNPILIGSYEKLHRETGWEPTHSIEQSLEKIYNYWYNKLS
ncbi:GDP-6-deoxy-D-mannose reductase [Methanoculleus chikugoensis]|uniref:GDP-6-deoxy-D-mannose reductase n=1 Tax=Methanoculleus chikugoensis TaxID=118126 RepID=A0A1M4MLU7_9EURY|nr:GDP-mannose 4,6-dehydratase [Methanoculleus chikugoensis]SCL75810.1 GDP-6-deoxy-D-mannose reductase [Methanoculleus chikugoensis]